MTIEDWAIHLEKRYLSSKDTELGMGYFSKDSREGWFTQLYYSTSTGWSQVLFYSANLQTETVILRIDYYPTALEAICDNSIFSPGLTLYMS